MQIRCEAASNKQNNILVNNHQGTRCSGTGSSAGATEKSEALSYLLRTLKMHFFFILSVLHLNRGCITQKMQQEMCTRRGPCFSWHSSGSITFYQTPCHIDLQNWNLLTKCIFNCIITCHPQFSSMITNWWAKGQKYDTFVVTATEFINIY